MENILKIIGVLVSVFALYKIIIDVVIARSSKHREEYQFTKDFLQDLNDEKTHPFILEKGFLALTGKSFSVPEMKYLLSFTNPREMISYRSSSGKFIEFKGDPLAYSWKKKYQEKNKIIFSWLYMIGYVLFASLAIFPVYIKGIDTLTGIPIISFSLSLSVVAVICLINHENFQDATKLMYQQNNT